MGLVLAGSGFGALGVVTERACTGEVAISVKTSSAQYGPEGAAAGLRAASDGSKVNRQDPKDDEISSCAPSMASP